MSIKQLVINPGSTSTKLAVFEDDRQVLEKSIPHPAEELKEFPDLYDQIPYRLEAIRGFLRDNGLKPSDFDVIMCRGGMVWGIGMGGFRVNEALAETLRNEEYTSPHASNLGGIMGRILAEEGGIDAYIYDAVTAASLPKFAAITGFPEIVRRSSCHVLNMHAMAEQYAADHGLDYAEQRLLIVHMGGGISYCAMDHGQIIDSIGDDDGPFSPERAGFTQILPIVKMCYSGDYTYAEMKQKIRGNGGFKAYFGTSSMRDIEKMVEDGDPKAVLLYDAEAYQIAKGVCELSVAFKGDVDAIILTGGLAYSDRLTSKISEYVKFIAPIYIYPGENEMLALARGGVRIMNGTERAKEFDLQDIIEANKAIV